MLKRMCKKKLLVATTVLFSLSLLYLMPTNKELKIKEELEYVDKNIITKSIYLLDSNNYLAKTEVAITSDKIEVIARELIEVLIKDGEGENKIPSGFKSIIPSDTKINNLSYENNIIKIDFSDSLLDVKKEYESKIIESIIYTLTSLNDVDKVIIYVNGKILTELPKSKINLPSVLDRTYGINKTFDITSSKNVSGTTIYFLNKYNDDYYFVPVTKYTNNEVSKIDIIINELKGNSFYNTNLMSFLNNNVKLLNVSEEKDTLILNFNKAIFNDADEKNILEEVVYSIALSAKDNYHVQEVIIKVEDEEIVKTVLKTIE